MIGVGIIGTGFGRAVHVPGFLKVRGAVVVGVASGDPERARKVAAEFSLPRCFATWQELIECPDVQAVSIATPPYLREEIALAALAAGKAVLCEKPMAMNAAQASRMLEAARKAGVVHMVDFEFREIPVWRFLKQQLEAGKLGVLRHVNVCWTVQSWADANRRWSWRSDSAQGGGATAALGVHVLDLMEWLMGPVKSVAAHFSVRIRSRLDDLGACRLVTGEDFCHFMLELADGTPASAVISAVAPLGRGLWIEVYGDKVLVVGTGNVVDSDEGFCILEGMPGQPGFRKLPVPKELEFRQEFADRRIAPFVSLAQRFIGAIHDSRLDVHPSFEDGFRVQLMVDAASRSHRERRWIDLSVARAAHLDEGS